MNATTKATMTLLTAMLAMTACNGDVEPPATAEPQDEQSVFDPMTDQLEKAKKVDAAAMQHKDDIDKALERAEAAPDDRK